MSRRLSKEEIEDARRRNSNGEPWALIARRIGLAAHALRRQADADYLASRRERDREASRQRRGATPLLVVRSEVEPPSPFALAEREEAQREPMTLTQMLMGDPPPSRSASGRGA